MNWKFWKKKQNLKKHELSFNDFQEALDYVKGFLKENEKELADNILDVNYHNQYYMLKDIIAALEIILKNLKNK